MVGFFFQGEISYHRAVTVVLAVNCKNSILLFCVFCFVRKMLWKIVQFLELQNCDYKIALNSLKVNSQ